MNVHMSEYGFEILGIVYLYEFTYTKLNIAEFPVFHLFRGETFV